MNILQINSSVRGSASHSTCLANAAVARLRLNQPSAALTVRDLGLTPPQALDGFALGALSTPAEQRSPEQHARVASDDALIAEVRRADVLVLAVPMYNFSIPSQLKCWIDAIARAKVTFQYTASGPQGLLTGKKVYVLLVRGGLYRDTARDSQVPFLKAILAFLGMTDVVFIYAEGMAMGPQAERDGLAGARTQIEEALPTLAIEPSLS